VPARQIPVIGGSFVIAFFTKAIAAAIAAGAISPHEPQTAPPPAQDDSAAQGAASGQQSKNFFNPQISLVTDFRWNAMNSDRSVRKRAFLKEAELALAADVDPYLRAEAYIAFADEDGEKVAEVEEAFGRYNNLGRGLSAKFGKIAAAIGRVQRNHVDQLNWLDFPLVTQDFLGEEGLRGGGASVSYLFPGDRFNEITIEGMDAPDEGIFGGAHAANPVFIGHYRTFFDFSEDKSAQLGLSFASGGNSGARRAQVYGVDTTYKWQPGTPGKSLTFEGEAFWAKPGEPGSETAFGSFAAVTYQFRPRLFGYVKYDYSEVPGTSDIHQGLTLGATLKVTEFHHWRAEFQRINSNFERDRSVLNLQFQWIIGAHPAHKY
jgi:hypothetical protein